MTNAYDAEAPAQDTSSQGQGKQPQQTVNYRMGNPQRSCGLCGNFTGSAGSNAYQCQTVSGDISPYGYCDIYQRQDNPFIAGTQEGFNDTGDPSTSAQDETAAETSAPTEEPDQPSLQIGNRRYA